MLCSFSSFLLTIKGTYILKLKTKYIFLIGDSQEKCFHHTEQVIARVSVFRYPRGESLEESFWVKEHNIF